MRKYLPEVALTTDIIVGFPGETEEDYQECYDFAKEIGFSKIHVFPYSPKKGTPAAERTDQLPNTVKAERSHKLLALSDEMSADFIQNYVGKTVEVLYEKPLGEGMFEGHTSNYIKVHGKSLEDVSNRIVKTRITHIEGEIAIGQVIL